MYSNIISWTKFSEYINNDRAVSGLQAILPNGKSYVWKKITTQRKCTCLVKKDYFEKIFA
ncbi:MAG: hypothetical protein CM15mV96_400 [uncultured marine virus]|nr:MAG: hypothetical protein CM15mV96_400 [uncultured marine virus]